MIISEKIPLPTSVSPRRWHNKKILKGYQTILPNSKPLIIIVDDNEDMVNVLMKIISRSIDAEVTGATSGNQALAMAGERVPDVVVTDVMMPDIDGLELLRRLKLLDDNIGVIVITGYGTIESAVEALKNGAYDYFQKPFDNERLVHIVNMCLEHSRLRRENTRLQKRLINDSISYGLVGSSPKIRKVLELFSRIADTDVTVLIRGESGTGKELAARALHAMSSRASHQMVTVNCPALPEHILESELFGYSRGAFTGATSAKKGLFLAARGSSILLDEIADIPVSIQTKLLRVLQEKEVRPLGSTTNVKVDVRVIASTNQDLEQKIKEGQFREDLFYRLNVVSVTMPSLRDIPEDIPLIANYFLKKYSEKYNKDSMSFSNDAVKCLVSQRWPGNVRQLENTVKRAVLLAESSEICSADIPPQEGSEPSTQPSGMPCFENLPYKDAKSEVISFFTTRYLARALEKTKGNVTAAAGLVGLERQALQRILRKYGIKSADFRKENTGSG